MQEALTTNNHNLKSSSIFLYFTFHQLKTGIIKKTQFQKIMFEFRIFF